MSDYDALRVAGVATLTVGIRRCGKARPLLLMTTLLAVRAVGQVRVSASPQPRTTIAAALALGSSKQAVPVLINLYSDGDSLVQNSVCGSLESLTHRFWCSIPASETDFQSAWRRWWRKHGATTRIYGVDQCPVIGKSENLDY